MLCGPPIADMNRLNRPDPGKGFDRCTHFLDYFNRVAHYEWWVVLVELLLIGLVIWWVVDFLEGTRGERLFRGVIFILVSGVLVLNLVVAHLPFDRLQYLYRGFLIAVLIVAVAGFQPEIRRVLIQIGQPRIWAGSSHQLSRTVEELVTAVTELSAARIGAIIVIERQVALGEFIETGVRLDARVTSDLLKTIFYPGTPLHDMAVVVRGRSARGRQRAVAAGRGRQRRGRRAGLAPPGGRGHHRRVRRDVPGRQRGNGRHLHRPRRQADPQRHRIPGPLAPGGRRDGGTRSPHGTAARSAIRNECKSMIKKLKPGKISIVVFLTALIWVWADLAQDDRLTLSDVRIEVAKSTDPSLWVNFVVERSGPEPADLRGARYGRSQGAGLPRRGGEAAARTGAPWT